MIEFRVRDRCTLLFLALVGKWCGVLSPAVAALLLDLLGVTHGCVFCVNVEMEKMLCDSVVDVRREQDEWHYIVAQMIDEAY